MLSFDKSDSFDDESDDDGSEYGSAGTCPFPFRFDESVVLVGYSLGRVSGVISLTGIQSIGDIFPLVVFVPKGVNFKVGRLIEIFLRPKS